MKWIAHILAAGALWALALPATASDVVYLPGLRIGFAPMAGLAPARRFNGYESMDHGVKVLVAELPTGAYAEVNNAFKSRSDGGSVKVQSIDTPAGKAYYTIENGKDGSDNVRRFSMIAPGPTFSGYVAVQVAEAAEKNYSDDAVRKMFASITIRGQVPVEEQLSLLPFKVTELGGFKTVRTLPPGGAILLGDGDEKSGIESHPFMVIATVTTAPDNPDDRGRFARDSAEQIPGVRDAKFTMSEPQRINGIPGYETRLEGVSGKDNTPVKVVQWLRFGAGTTALRMIASTPRDQWETAFPRFRKVRDGIQPR